MSKNVILITGTPCVGKTTVAKMVADRLNAEYVNLTELALNKGLILCRDEQRDTWIVDENKMRSRIRRIIEKSDKESVVVDGHYAVRVVPKGLVTKIIVLRRNPVELRKLMEERGYKGNKLWENLASEILDVCLGEALNAHGTGKVCEVDATGKSAEEVAVEVMEVLSVQEKCRIGLVDWLGELERKGILEEYLRI
ncbi:MAG: adenylate kinase family protein [Candidatus Bathyarchaeia archaeon]